MLQNTSGATSLLFCNICDDRLFSAHSGPLCPGNMGSFGTQRFLWIGAEIVQCPIGSFWFFSFIDLFSGLVFIHGGACYRALLFLSTYPFTRLFQPFPSALFMSHAL
jgi:hypothetical protein